MSCSLTLRRTHVRIIVNKTLCNRNALPKPRELILGVIQPRLQTVLVRFQLTDVGHRYERMRKQTT